MGPMWHVKKLYEVRNTYFVEQIYHFLGQDASDLILDSSVGRAARERSGGHIRNLLLSTSFHHVSPRSYITQG
jgi:hypothetical protein